MSGIMYADSVLFYQIKALVDGFYCSNRYELVVWYISSKRSRDDQNNCFAFV